MEETQSPFSATEEEASLLVTLAENVKLLLQA